MTRFALPALVLPALVLPAVVLPALVISLVCAVPALAQAPAAASAPEQKQEVCFEGRKGATEVVRKDIRPGLPNVKCSPTTGAALWYSDPYDGTVPMGKMPLLDKIPDGQAVVKPRSEKLNLLAQCGIAQLAPTVSGGGASGFSKSQCVG